MFATKFEFLKILKTKTIKMSRIAIVNFEIVYKTEFTCGMRGHHVYKANWTHVLNVKLNCEKDNHEEAVSYDRHSVGVFKNGGTLVDHIPIDLSQLIDYSMKDNKKNFISALVVGLRKRKVEVVVSVKFTALTKELRVVTILRDFKNKDKICLNTCS